jgi:hypothetical protein
MANAMPEEKIPHSTASKSPNFKLNHPALQLNLLLMTGIGGDRHSNHPQQQPCHVVQAAPALKQSRRLPGQQRRHQRANHKVDADGHTHAQGDPQVAHRQAVTHIANPPHGSEKSGFPQHARSDRCIEDAKVRQQQHAHPNRQQYPGEESGHGPGCFP